MTLLRRLPRMRKMPSERPPSSKRAPTAAEVAYLGFSATWAGPDREHFDVRCDGAYVGRFSATRPDVDGRIGLYPQPALPDGVIVQLLMKLREKG